MKPHVMDIAEAFTIHLRRWGQKKGLSAEILDALAAAGRHVATLTNEGHVCVPLSDVARGCGIDLPVLRQRLRLSGLVGTPSDRDSALLVLDEADRLYLHRHFDYETRLAVRLARALREPVLTPGPDAQACLRAQFQDLKTDGGHWQALAAGLALLRRWVVISGGPGTGKTTTVAKLLSCLLADTPGLRIALAAPTGKAAARLGASLRASKGLTPAVRERLEVVPTTVHRLLGYGPSGFRYHAEQRLPFDVVVIDEASMLDLSLATRLLEAVPDDARLLLLGDRNQLEAVESGAVFAELCATHSLTPVVRESLAHLTRLPPESVDALCESDDPMADAVIWFTKTYRFEDESAIGQLAVAVQNGQAASAIELLQSESKSLGWHASAAAAPTRAELELLRSGFHDYYGQVSLPSTTPIEALKAFDTYRVLAATRDGPWGVQGLNPWLAQPLRERRATVGPWYVGRPVLVTRNDAVVGLYNGDVGIALAEPDGSLRVWFEGGDTGPRAFAPSQLPPHETAFAMTIHKSQGSEFAAVAVVLPPAPSAILSRELLYTALTRARSRVHVVGSKDSIETAIGKPSTRVSGLRARVRHALLGVQTQTGGAGDVGQTS